MGLQDVQKGSAPRGAQAVSPTLYSETCRRSSVSWTPG